MDDVLVLVSPTSGRGKAGRLAPALSRGLRRAGLAHEVVISREPAHAQRTAARAAERGALAVVAVGGDGMVHLCANGLIGSETALAVVPAGTGNDFARCLGLDPKAPLGVVELLASGRLRAVDAVLATGPGWRRHYVCVAGVGFDSETNAYANTLTRLRGTPRYVAAVFRTLVRFRPASFRVSVDGAERRLGAMLVAVGNAASYGGGMRVCPDASLDDGLLDVCVVGAMSKLSFVRAFPKVFSGKHVYHPAVITMRGSEIEVEAARPFEVYVDGERGGPLPARFEVLPGALRVVAP